MHAGGGWGVGVSVRWAGSERQARRSESSERERGKARDVFLDTTITSASHL
jgi:hypothetical protein